MKAGDKVFLKTALTLMPVLDGAASRSAAGTKEFSQGTQFQLVTVRGEQATVKDSDGNFWSVLVGLLGLVQDVSEVNSDTTIGEAVGLGKRIVNFFKSVVERFRKKKK